MQTLAPLKETGRSTFVDCLLYVFVVEPVFKDVSYQRCLAGVLVFKGLFVRLKCFFSKVPPLHMYHSTSLNSIRKQAFAITRNSQHNQDILEIETSFIIVTYYFSKNILICI